MLNSKSLIYLTKRNFFWLFQGGYNKAFILKNIHSGWEKTSIYPFKLEVVLDKFIVKIASIEAIKNKPLFKELFKLVLTAYNQIRIKAKLKEVIINVFDS